MKRVFISLSIVAPLLVAAFLLGMRLGETKVQRNGNTITADREVVALERSAPFGMSSPARSTTRRDLSIPAVWSQVSTHTDSPFLSRVWDEWTHHQAEWENINRAIDSYKRPFFDEYRESETYRNYCHLNSWNSPMDRYDTDR
jgi:hypothetical protein